MKISSQRYAQALEKRGGEYMRFYGKRGGEKMDKLLRPLELLLFVVKNRIEVLYSPTHHGLPIPIIPQVITLFDLQPLVFKDRKASQRFYFRYILPWILKKSPWVIVGSHFTRLEAIRAYGLQDAKTRVVYVGPPLEDRSYLHPRDNYFLMVGGALSHKNLEVIVKALDTPEELNLRVKVAGGLSPYLKGIEEECERKGLSHMAFLGGVSRENLVELYQRALALLFPSLYEGFGMPLLEAMTLGCPTLASQSSALWEVGGKASLYAHPQKGEEWREKMLEIKTNPWLRKKLTFIGMTRARKFSWTKAGKAIKELLDSI